MSKKITTNLADSEPLPNISLSPKAHHKKTQSNPFMFKSVTGSKDQNVPAHIQLRIKTEEKSLECPKKYSVNMPLSLGSPKKAKWVTSDMGLRET